MKIGNFDLEKDGTYIIAELSSNHNGSIENAFKSIKAIKETGANAVKLQTYTPDMMSLNSNKDDFIIKNGTIWDGKSLYELYTQAQTPLKWHKELFNYAKSIDIDIFSSPFSKDAVDFLEELDPLAYKIASFEITDYDLIAYTASKDKPIIISIGIASIDEIQDIVNICKKQGNANIILLQCTSSYPAKYENANLKMIPNLSTTFNCASGLSDHTIGSTAPIIAVSLGAKVIEKHFILDKSIKSLDSNFSMDKEEFANMVKDIRNTEKLLGKIDYSLNKEKKRNRTFARSLYICKDIKKGEIFTEKNIKSIRPSYGAHPKYLKNILGKVAKKDYKFASRLDMSSL